MGPSGQGTCADQEGCLGHRTALSTENPAMTSMIRSDDMNTGPGLGCFPERFRLLPFELLPSCQSNLEPRFQAHL